MKFAIRSWLKIGRLFEALDQHRLTTAETQKRDPWGCMAGTVTILPGTDLTAPSDEIWTAEEGHLLNE